MNKPGIKTHTLEVWGDFACFTRPEMAVERYSYPCPTPSAARGIFEAIYFKPQFYWQITKIELLNPPTYIALRRNEVKDKISASAVKKWMNGTAPPEANFADGVAEGKGRTQRQTMALRSPRFRIHGQMVAKHSGVPRNKSIDSQFVRRAKTGKCFQQPYFGCKEFVCFFRLIEDLTTEANPCDYSQDVGFMLYDVFDLSVDNHSEFKRDGGSVRPSISMFSAKIQNGVLTVPELKSDQVLKVSGTKDWVSP